METAPAPPDDRLLTIFRQQDAEAVRRHPAFRRAAERHCDLALAERRGALPAVRWLFGDIDRAAVLTRLVMTDADQGSTSLADLLDMTQRRRTSSPGRVIQAIRRAEHLDLVAIAEEGRRPWKRRRLVARPALTQVFRGRLANELRAAAMVAPEVGPALDALADDAILRRLLAQLRRFDQLGAALRGPPTPSVRRFIQHEAGLPLLRALLVAQPRDRAAFLGEAPFSARALSQRAFVSRSHVTRLFRAAEAAGLLSLERRGLVAVSPELSDEFERFFAVTFQVLRACAVAALEDGAAPA